MTSILTKIKSLFTSKKLPHIKDCTDLEGVSVLVRADFNIPVRDDGSITPDEAWRIESARDTIMHLQSQGARTILISHAGNADQSMQPIAQYLQELLDITIGFIPQISGSLVEEALDRMGNGQVILLENLRSDAREKNNNDSFAEMLASYADIYVNEAFSASHREHASIVGVPQLLPTYFGFQFHREYEGLKKAHNPKKPLLLIVGGAKFDTKLPLIQSMIPHADEIFVGGALAHTFFKYQGLEIGNSLFEEYPAVRELLDTENIMTPSDVVVQGIDGTRTASNESVHADDRIVDLGDASIEELTPYIHQARTIIWNGPLGWYEGGFDGGTKKLLDAIAASAGYSIIGGGDTVTVIRAHAMQDNFSFISTAGGAMLDFLTDGTLPGIEAVEKI